MTVSIVGRSEDAQYFGVAIASSSPAVAARCVRARRAAGAVATQNVTDPRLGPLMLEALQRGADAKAAVGQALLSTPFAEYRQLLCIGREGPPYVHSGGKALGCVAAAQGRHSAAAGNLLAYSEVPAAMINAFESAAGHLGARLLQALIAGRDAGGEAGPLHSAGLLVVRDVAWPIVDLRVDWTVRDPIAELAGIWAVYSPQIEDYVRRAIDPSNSPSFGVPGDL